MNQNSTYISNGQIQSYVRKKFPDVKVPLLDLSNIFTILEINQNATWHEIIQKYKSFEVDNIRKIELSYLRLYADERRKYVANQSEACAVLSEYHKHGYLRKCGVHLNTLKGFLKDFPDEFELVPPLQLLKKYIILICKKNGWEICTHRTKTNVKFMVKLEDGHLCLMTSLPNHIQNENISLIPHGYFIRAMKYGNV
jgi:hypothetical protein